MTEAEWLRCQDPRRMLEFLRGRTSDRKLRLFATACASRVWGLLRDERSRALIRAAERYAEGVAYWEECESAALAHDSVPRIDGNDPHHLEAVNAARATAYYDPAHAADEAVSHAARASVASSTLTGPDVYSGGHALPEHAARVTLLRCIFGNPFRPTFVSDRAWLQLNFLKKRGLTSGESTARTFDHALLRWNGGIIPLLAAAAYEERQLPSGHLDPIRLALLADMLEDAGCADGAILEHLRGPGPHVRGCFVVDLLLGKG